MKNYKRNIKNVWQYHFGDRAIVRDVSGRQIDFALYNYFKGMGWTIDHIKPISKGGTDRLENLIPMHYKTNKEKKDSYPMFVSNGNTFVIKKIKRERGGKYRDAYKIETKH